MDQIWLLILFFVFTLSAIGLAGYYFVLRNEPIPVADTRTTREAIVDTLRNLGSALPAVRDSNASLRRLLIAAGYRSPEAPIIFNGACYATAVLLGLICALITAINTRPVDAIMAFICAAGFGYLLPKRILSRIIAQRRRRLAAGLPTALDLMVLSVEAGQALDQAIIEASREIRRTYPDLADEFTAMYLALRTSTSREEVFRDFGQRSGEPEMRKLANLLIDSDRFGTGLAPTLRTHGRYLRIRRRQLAQERARKVAVKLVFPIFFLVFPSVLLVTLGPAVLQIRLNISNLLQ